MLFRSQLCLVVGSKNSSNANKLKKIGNLVIKTYLIDSLEDIKLEWLDEVYEVTVTSAASSPEAITNEVIDFLIKYNKKDPNTWNLKSKLKIKDII